MAGLHGRFVWYELTTTDLNAAKAFYAAVMGWGTRDASMPGMPYTLLTVTEDPVAGAMELPPQARNMGAQPRWLGYVAVDDVDGAADRLKRLGGTVFVPPTDVPDVSRFSIVADPQGAMLAVIKWQGKERAVPRAAHAAGRVGWHELLATDWRKAFSFYGELFGWQSAKVDVAVTGDYHQTFACGEETIGGMANKPATVSQPFWLYYFNTDDIDVAVQRVSAGGGSILEGPALTPEGGLLARCADPQGATFALTGPRGSKSIGYFEPAASRDPAAVRRFVANKKSSA
jgi:predicted enzyme related to lactoylglutathione lyase